MGWAYVTIDRCGPDGSLLIWHAFIAFSVMAPGMRPRLRESVPMVQRLGPTGRNPVDEPERDPP